MPFVRREAKEEFISNLHLIGKEGLSYAAALLFTEKAEKWIPGAYVKVGKFGRDEADLLYNDDVHGSLIEQAEKTLDLIYFKYLKAKIWYENGVQRVEKFPFPHEALRELILNALVHKDYASFIPIQISVSDDKIFVANVGSLPEEWTLEKLLGKHSSRPRNPTIASCIYLTGKIETWGRGIRKVFDECAQHGCPPPVYEVSAGDPGDIQVRIDAAPDAIVNEQEDVVASVQIQSTTPKNNSGSREKSMEKSREKILTAIRENPNITMAELASVTGLSAKGVEKNIRILREGNLIHRVGPDKGGHWEIVEAARDRDAVVNFTIPTSADRAVRRRR